MKTENMKLRLADSNDIEPMRELIFTHGPNEWNYLPKDGITRELENVRSGAAEAVVVEVEGGLVGLAVFYCGFVRFPDLVARGTEPSNVGYIEDVVVSREHAGEGLGSKMLERAAREFGKRNVEEVYIDCHEENLASLGMMRKAGFERIAVFYDPERRFSGSRKTCVRRLDLQQDIPPGFQSRETRCMGDS